MINRVNSQTIQKQDLVWQRSLGQMEKYLWGTKISLLKQKMGS